ncbi:MAG: methionine synthase [Anaerolineaceae bacterium]|nr:methionine synthase [Anaerolineaceae bacterium]
MKTIVAAALGECVHVAGVINFLRLAELEGWRTVFLGPAVDPSTVLEAAQSEKADLVAVSYRLTPETGERLLAGFCEDADELRESGVQFAFGGTPPVAERARKFGFFHAIFDGYETTEDVVAYLRGEPVEGKGEEDFPQTTIERIRWKAPYPILRHHYGQPTMQATIAGIQKIAESRLLDVISLGIDQDAQENFFNPERQNPQRFGAGGVPVRSAEEYRFLFEASRSGNFPLLRTYTGTDDFLRLAEMYVDTIHNAWCAVPLFWFNRMDGRGPWELKGSIEQHQQVMSWYGRRNIPVELNEAHHWGMRDATDVTFVVSAFLAAYNARAFGVCDHIVQMMFNSPPGGSDRMDLAKMLALLEMIETLETDSFHIWRQTRTGLLSYPLQPDAARAHLAASVYVQMAVKPHIVHIVGHTEAHHAATAEDIIEACQMARRVIENALRGQPDLTADPLVQARKTHLIKEAQVTLNAIRGFPVEQGKDAFTDSATLTRAVETGILDAPHLKNNPYARGEIRTRIINGGCEAVDEQGNFLSEADRVSTLQNH